MEIRYSTFLESYPVRKRFDFVSVLVRPSKEASSKCTSKQAVQWPNGDNRGP